MYKHTQTRSHFPCQVSDSHLRNSVGVRVGPHAVLGLQFRHSLLSSAVMMTPGSKVTGKEAFICLRHPDYTTSLRKVRDGTQDRNRRQELKQKLQNSIDWLSPHYVQPVFLNKPGPPVQAPTHYELRPPTSTIYREYSHVLAFRPI